MSLELSEGFQVWYLTISGYGISKMVSQLMVPY